jgi:hypothetical protein
MSQTQTIAPLSSGILQFLFRELLHISEEWCSVVILNVDG